MKMKTKAIPKINKTPKVKVTGNNNKKIFVGIGAFLVLAGAGYWYYKKKKKKDEISMLGMDSSDSEIARTITGSRRTSTRPTRPTRLIGSTVSSRPTRFRCTSSSYPLQYGTCNKDVKVLQSYLHKIYKADLGRSGRNRDGVDGMFGNKTNRAAKMHLQKTSFSKQDIDGMRTAIKTIK